MRTPSIPAGEVTRLLKAWGEGDESARDRLIPIVYRELRKRAAGYLRHERPGHTLLPTDLVHEAYLRLCEQNAAWQNREQFFAVASRLMRRILVDHARDRARDKRGGGIVFTAIDGKQIGQSTNIDAIALDEALDRLAAIDPQQSRIVELRFFGGLTIEETADALDISPATVKREWTWAKAWLYQQLGGR